MGVRLNLVLSLIVAVLLLLLLVQRHWASRMAAAQLLLAMPGRRRHCRVVAAIATARLRGCAHRLS